MNAVDWSSLVSACVVALLIVLVLRLAWPFLAVVAVVTFTGLCVAVGAAVTAAALVLWHPVKAVVLILRMAIGIAGACICAFAHGAYGLGRRSRSWGPR